MKLRGLLNELTYKTPKKRSKPLVWDWDRQSQILKMFNMKPKGKDTALVKGKGRLYDEIIQPGDILRGIATDDDGNDIDVVVKKIKHYKRYDFDSPGMFWDAHVQEIKR